MLNSHTFFAISFHLMKKKIKWSTGSAANFFFQDFFRYFLFKLIHVVLWNFKYTIESLMRKFINVSNLLTSCILLDPGSQLSTAIAHSNQLFSADPRVMLVIVSPADLFCTPYLQQCTAFNLLFNNLLLFGSFFANETLVLLFFITFIKSSHRCSTLPN